MSDKTNVSGALVAESSKDKLPGGEGESQHKEIENKIRENLRGEYARKETELSEKLEASNERLAELEEKVRLTEAEKAERARLENRVEGMESELYELEHNPKYRAYNEKIQRTAVQTKKEAIEEAKHEFSVEQMQDFIEDKSDELGMKPKELEKELDSICKDGRYRNFLPHIRAKKALKDLLSQRNLAKEREEIRKEKEKLNNHSEGDGKEQVILPYSEARKKGNIVGILKSLGQY